MPDTFNILNAKNCLKKRGMVTPLKRAFRPGQGGLIAVAITVVVTLVLVSGALSGMSALNASRTVVTKQTLQTYYIAQSGIQEALATRMVPRNNSLNYTASGDKLQKAFYQGSGLIYRNPDPVNPTGLLGQYRYIIVGGQGARNPADGSYYDQLKVNNNSVPQLLVTDTIPDTSPFIVISNASVCKSNTNRSAVIADTLISGSAPACKAGYYLDELTLVAQARLNREMSGTKAQLDRATQLRMFKNSNAITLPAGAQVPGYSGWQAANSTINFNTAWTSGSVTPNRIIVYNFADNSFFANQAIAATAGVTSIPGTIPAKGVLRLYFNEAIDFRSISPSYDPNLADCKAAATVANCRIRVWQNTSSNGDPNSKSSLYTGNTMIPLLPDGSQLILLPPITPSDQVTGNVYNAIQIDAGSMRTANGKTGSGLYTIVFKTQ